jgi:hypothetical protein
MPVESTLALTVFIASPGDVAEEREFVREFLESILPLDPLLRAAVAFQVVSWDHPNAGTPMPASLAPQEAVIRFKSRPADCDIVIVILASRMGMPLGPEFKRPDGSRPSSGTEWEYEDAWQATPRPDILVYRRKDIEPISRGDPRARELLDQYSAVEQFFERFENRDGSMQGGFTPYTGISDFKTKVANDLKHLLVGRLSQQVGIADGSHDPIVPPARCFGRDRYAAPMIDAVTKRKSAALVVLGSPGIGKTTLTRQVATNEIIIAHLGDLALNRSAYDVARKAYMQALPGFRAIACALGEASCMVRLGEIGLNRSEYDAAHASYLMPRRCFAEEAQYSARQIAFED